MRSESFPIGETVYQETLANGLEVVLLPKPGFEQSFVTFTTKYGSIDRSFRTSNDNGLQTSGETPRTSHDGLGAAKETGLTIVPDGIAHFLEHKMFESESGDVFPRFARGGASANAFTTFDQTTYLFSCTDNLLANTELLLDFVQDPYFTEKSVEKEKGIIGQEIQMYNDNPDARIFFELLKALYVDHPIRIEISGSVASIDEITKDTLYDCYRTFYHPSNMVFFAVGGFDPEAMMGWIRENQSSKQFSPIPKIERAAVVEPEKVHSARVETQLAVSQPRCLVGWKDVPAVVSGKQLMVNEMLTGVVLDALFGRSSLFYHRAIDEGLIDNQFSWEYERALTYGFSVIGGNTQNPDELVQAIQSCIDGAVEGGLSSDDFERSRRKAIGRFFGTLDSPSYIARVYVSYQLREAQLFDTIPVLEALALADANRRLREHFAPARRAVSIVHA